MVTHSFYEADNRVTRYAEALAERGDHVEILALRRSAALPADEVINGVRVSRIQYRDSKSREAGLAYLLATLRFLIATTWILFRRQSRTPYDVIHVHNMPDFLVFASIYPRLRGAKVILDIHDVVPELYSSKFGASKRRMRVLYWMERVSAAFAHHVIVANDLWHEKYAARTKTTDRCSIFINNVDTRLYRANLRTRSADGRFIVLFPGGLQWHQGLDIAIRAFPLVLQQLPNAEFHIYGDGNMKASLQALSRELSLTEKVKFFEPVPIREIVAIMANADAGVVPKRADSFGNEAYSTKIMEFMALGVPVVVSRTKIDQFYFDDKVVKFFESGNHEALAHAIVEVFGDETFRNELVKNGLEYSMINGWSARKLDYLKLVDSLIIAE